MSTEGTASAISAAGHELDRQLAELRAREHDLTPREAADERVRILETHLAAIRLLRERMSDDTTEGDA